MARLAWLGAAAAVAILVMLWAQTEHARREASRQAMRAEVQDDVTARGRSAGAIDRNVQLVRGLVAVVSFEPGIADGRFARLGEQVLRAASEIRHIAAAPDLVIRSSIPSRATRRSSGSTTATCRISSGSRWRATSGSTVLAGPIDLVQGGRGFIARSPVFIDDGTRASARFWGIVSTVIDAAAL